MNFTDFKEWLEENTNGYGIFIRKACDLQEEKNKKEPGRIRNGLKRESQRKLNLCG